MISIQHKIQFTDVKTNIKFNLNYFNSVYIESDLSQIYDVCTIKLPLKTDRYTLTDNQLFFLNENGFQTTSIGLQKGMCVDVELFHLNKQTNQKQFIGFIESIKDVESVIEIKCLDYSYLFGLFSTKLSYKSVKLIDVMRDLINLIPDDYTDYRTFLFNSLSIGRILDVDLGQFRIDGYKSGKEILEYIRSTYKINIFFRLDTTSNPFLYANFAYPLIEGYSKPFIVSEKDWVKKTIPTISVELNSNAFDKNTLVVTVISGDSKVSVALYKPENTVTDLIELSKKFEPDEKKQKDKLDELLKDYTNKVDIKLPKGYNQAFVLDYGKEYYNNYAPLDGSGNITILGQPIIKHGDKIAFQKNKNEYFVDKVITYCDSSSGFIQNIELGSRIK